MNYQIHITSIVQNDINEAKNYIDNILKNKIAADKLLDEISNKISSLEIDPYRHNLENDIHLNSLKIRMILINNYYAFYKIDETNKIVYIVRILYRKRNWQEILSNVD